MRGCRGGGVALGIREEESNGGERGGGRGGGICS